MDKENQKEIDAAIMAVIGNGEEEIETPVVEEKPVLTDKQIKFHDSLVITMTKVNQLCTAVDGKIDSKYLQDLIGRGLAE